MASSAADNVYQSIIFTARLFYGRSQSYCYLSSVYPCSLLFTFVHPYSCLFTFVHPYSCLFTFVHPYSCLFTFVYPYLLIYYLPLPLLIHAYPYLPLFILICFSSPLLFFSILTFIYLYLPLSALFYPYFRLDESLYRACRRDAKDLCENENIGEPDKDVAPQGMTLACLYRHILPNMNPDPAKKVCSMHQICNHFVVFNRLYPLLLFIKPVEIL